MKRFFYVLMFAAAALPLPVSAQRQPAKQQDAVRYYEELMGNMTQQVKLLQDENARLDAKLADMDRRLGAAMRENQSVKAEMDDLRKLVRSSDAERDAQFRKLAEQLDKLAKMPLPPPPVQPTGGNRGKAIADPGPEKPPVPEKFEEYIVQAGATLGVIAKAYDVSVQDIMRANHLKNDRLRIGQKLLIPVKK